MSKSFLPRGFLKWIAYENFHHPIIFQRVMTNSRLGRNTRLEYKKLLHHYHLLFQRLISLLDVIYADYDEKRDYFVESHPILNFHYAVILQLLIEMQQVKQFKQAYHIGFDDFYTLEGDYKRKYYAWEQQRGKYLDYLAEIDKLCRFQGVKVYPLPYRLEQIVKYTDKNIVCQQEERLSQNAWYRWLKWLKKWTGLWRQVEENWNESDRFELYQAFYPNNYRWVSDLKYQFGSHGQIEFQNTDKNRYKIFKMLVTEKGKPIAYSELAKKLDISSSNVTTVLGQLRKIVEENTDKKISIVAHNGKAYIRYGLE